MIFIVGSSFSVEDLPSFTDYQIFPAEKHRAAKMAMRVAAAKLTAAYIPVDLKNDFAVGNFIGEELYDKFVFYTDEQKILDDLNKGSGVEQTAEVETEATEEKVIEEPVKTEDKPVVNTEVVNKPAESAAVATKPAESAAVMNKPVESAVINKTDSTKISVIAPGGGTADTEDDDITFMNSKVEGVEDIDDDDDFSMTDFQIPGTVGGNYDAVAAKLEAKEKQLEQYKSMMAEKVQEFDNALKDMDAANAELIEAYESKLNEASQAFNKVKTDLNYALSTAGKYHLYAEHYRSVLKEGFEPSIKEAIKALNLNLMIMCTVDNVTDMQFLIQENIEQFNENCVFVDLTGVSYFDMLYNTRLGGAFTLFEKMTDEQKTQLRNTVFHKNNADLIAEYNFHDVAFLDMDWLTFFTNLKELFPDRKIVLLFNSIFSFPVLYTVSKLATIFKSYLHLRCSPTAIKNAYMRLKFIPRERGIKIVATYYFDAVSDSIARLGKNYVVVTSADVLSISTIDKG